MNVWYLLLLLGLLIGVLFVVERVTRTLDPMVEAMESMARVLIQVKINTDNFRAGIERAIAAMDELRALFPEGTEPYLDMSPLDQEIVDTFDTNKRGLW